MVGSLKALTIGLTTLMLVVAPGCSDDSGEERSSSQEGQPTTGSFRGGRLPEGLSGKRASTFRLNDARDGQLDTRRLTGRPYMITFLYTDCRDVCPLIGREIGDALTELGPQRGEVEALAVSVDPEHDTAPAARRWLTERRLPDNFHYLIGDRRELKPVWDAYYVGPQPAGQPESLHTASIWLVDRKGRLRTKFSGGMPIPRGDIAHDLKLLLDEPA
jgi:protein SCO1/2